MPKAFMTIADLAAALRGIPRDAVLMIETPEGLRDLRFVQGMHGARRDDGTVVELDGRGVNPRETGYVVILCTAPGD